MPDINPAALSRIGPTASPSTSSTPLPSLKLINTSSSTASATKPSKTVSMGQRIDLESIYTSLKHSIDVDNWAPYKEAISLFVLGHLNQKELSARVDPFLTIDATTLHAHNQLIAALYGNVTRDLPDHSGVAAFVSANDKPNINISKPVSGDAAEQRLKREVMTLPARDRRRLKDIPDTGGSVDTVSEAVRAYHLAKGMRMPDMVPTSAGGHNKTNYDLSIRRRYLLPLSTETLEFPDPSSLLPRITPICHEAGLPQAPPDPAVIAQYLAVAAETFVKELLTHVYSKTRSDGPGLVQTEAYKKRLRHEEEMCIDGIGGITRDSAGLLPVEREGGANGVQKLTMTDLRIAWELGGGHWGLLGGSMNWGIYGEGEDEEIDVGVTGTVMELDDGPTDGDPMDVDDDEEEDDWGWEGAGFGDREALGGLLDECLMVGS